MTLRSSQFVPEMPRNFQLLEQIQVAHNLGLTHYARSTLSTYYPSNISPLSLHFFTLDSLSLASFAPISSPLISSLVTIDPISGHILCAILRLEPVSTTLALKFWFLCPYLCLYIAFAL